MYRFTTTLSHHHLRVWDPLLSRLLNEQLKTSWTSELLTRQRLDVIIWDYLEFYTEWRPEDEAKKNEDANFSGKSDPLKYGSRLRHHSFYLPGGRHHSESRRSNSSQFPSKFVYCSSMQPTTAKSQAQHEWHIIDAQLFCYGHCCRLPLWDSFNALPARLCCLRIYRMERSSLDFFDLLSVVFLHDHAWRGL